MQYKRIFTLAIVLCIAVSAVCGATSVTASAADFITNASQAYGSAYTNSAELAAALDEVFAGDIDMYRDASCTKERIVPLGGTCMTESNLFWIQNVQTEETVAGWQCYIYANAVYNKLFGEWIKHGDEAYAYSEIVLEGGQREVSFAMFVEAGIRCGAYMRTTANRDGSYNSSAAHSLIILSYTARTVTYLDGNSDGEGLVRINTRTWEDFNRTNLTGRNRRVAHVIQPTAEHYERLYPLSKDAGENADGKGDISGNGKIDARDYMILKRYVLHTLALTERQLVLADVTCDGKVDARDYMVLKMIVMGRYQNTNIK